MIDNQGRVLCDGCMAQANSTTMARVLSRELVLWGRHHGHHHIMHVPLFDLLPPPGSQEYSDLVAELVKRLPAI